MSLELRPATESDLPFLRDLHHTTLRSYVEQIWGWDDEQQDRLFDEGFDATATQVVQLGGLDIGTLSVKTGPDEIFLANIGLLPAYQSRGLGTRLIQTILDDADRLGIPVLLQVLRPNPARRLYERLGFTLIAESPERFTLRRPPTERGSSGSC